MTCVHTKFWHLYFTHPHMEHMYTLWTMLSNRTRYHCIYVTVSITQHTLYLIITSSEVRKHSWGARKLPLSPYTLKLTLTASLPTWSTIRHGFEIYPFLTSTRQIASNVAFLSFHTSKIQLFVTSYCIPHLHCNVISKHI